MAMFHTRIAEKERAEKEMAASLQEKVDEIRSLKEQLEMAAVSIEPLPLALGAGPLNGRPMTTEGDQEGRPTTVASPKRLRQPPLPEFKGASRDDSDAFDRWIRKFQKHAELEAWGEREKLLQFELHLSGSAERTYEVLPSDAKTAFDDAAKALRGRLHPIQREALTSAQLIKRKQRVGESVDEYAQDFERLFEKSYGQRPGMDQGSKKMLKRDLFVQGLLLKWQEKVLPSAESFDDALHQARATEEQEKQLAELHQKEPIHGKTQLSLKPFSSQHPLRNLPLRSGNIGQGNGGSSNRKIYSPNLPGTGHPPVYRPDRRSNGNSGQCYLCGSPSHRARECPQRHPPPEAPGRERGNRFNGTTSVITGHTLTSQPADEESLENRCQRLQKELAEAELQRMSTAYDDHVEVDTVTGAVGPLYYAQVQISGTPVEAMIDPGSSATIMSFDLFTRIGKAAGIQTQSLRLVDITLRDYSQRLIPVGAQVDLEMEWQGKAITVPVYLRWDRDNRGEPCLLGTNAVIPLGLMVPGPGVEPRYGQGLPERLQDPEVVTKPRAVVRLIQETRIPGHCGAFVEARVEGMDGRDPVVFEPDEGILSRCGIQLEESILQPDAEGRVRVLTCNSSPEAKRFGPNTILGQVDACECVDSGQGVWDVPQQTDLDTEDNTTHLPSQEGVIQHVTSTSAYMNQEAHQTSAHRKEKFANILNICRAGRTEDEVALIRDSVLEADDIFAVEEMERGEVVQVQHQIETGDHPPIKQPPRRVPFAVRGEILKLVEEMLQAQLIQESTSPWASPIVLVKKKDGSFRFCVDYRRVNAVTRKDVFPLPRIDDLLDQLEGKSVVSTLDAKSGYWQIQMQTASREKTAFVTLNGLYEFRVMPFGLCNAPATFQRLMQHTLAGLGGEKPFCSVTTSWSTRVPSKNM